MILAFRDAVMNKISHAHEQSHRDLSSVGEVFKKKLQETLTFLQEATKEGPEYLEISARDLAYSLARIYAGQ